MMQVQAKFISRGRCCPLQNTQQAGQEGQGRSGVSRSSRKHNLLFECLTSFCKQWCLLRHHKTLKNKEPWYRRARNPPHKNELHCCLKQEK
ncbi:hypothetical protein XELAEV_18038438mg [Xenopus laevis]|uniref:Uncharacterized protein n=1 Tax=Xenopus laevis TaxID=8355 RepID=A0A974C785_XENLA|nr:hypothetical protein XELAEV_18038438mg [Xenopus laevis]